MRKISVVLLLCLGTFVVLGEQIHVVQNETLGGIAAKYVSIAALQALNSISNPNLLFVGKKLKIPRMDYRK